MTNPEEKIQWDKNINAMYESPSLELKSFTQRIWSLDWGQHFPKTDRGSDITYAVSHYDEFTQFMKDHHRLFQKDLIQDTLFLMKDDRKSRSFYYREVGDFFVFRKGTQLAGVFCGHAMDWASYYLRWAFVLPQYRGQGIWQKFLKYFFSCLKNYDVDIVQGDVSPSNLVEIHLFTKLGFVITGQQLSERWGALLHFTKYLNEKNFTAFEFQFCTQRNPGSILQD